MALVSSIAVYAVIAGVSLLAGMLLGSILGKTGSIQFISFMARLPVKLFRTPGRIKEAWRHWMELRAGRKLRRFEFGEKIKDVKGEMALKRGEIKVLKRKIRRLRWELKEPG